MADLTSTKNQNKMRREMSQVMTRAVRLLLVLGCAAGITYSTVFLFFIIIIKGYWSLTLKYSFNTLLLVQYYYYYSSRSIIPVIVGLWYSISSLLSWLSSPLYRFLVLNFIIIFIAVSTIFYRSNISKIDDDDHNDDVDDCDVEVVSLSSAITPPSKQGGQYINQSHVQEDVTATIKTAVVTATATASSSSAYKISANKKADVCIQVFHKQDCQLGNGGRRSKIRLPPPVHPVKARNKTTTKTKTNLKRTKNHAQEVVMTGETKQHGGAKPANSHDKKKHDTSSRDNYEKDMIEREQTLEGTWKAIIMEREGKPPLWTPQRDVPPSLSATKAKQKKNALKAWQELRNSETFNDAVYAWRRGGLRRGASLTRDELNCQVEAFIKKNFHNIRLQRQESDQRFFENINRGD